MAPLIIFGGAAAAAALTQWLSNKLDEKTGGPAVRGIEPGGAIEPYMLGRIGDRDNDGSDDDDVLVVTGIEPGGAIEPYMLGGIEPNDAPQARRFLRSLRHGGGGNLAVRGMGGRPIGNLPPGYGG